MLTTILIVSILFFLGACIGSFLNVVLYRSTTGESWITGRSHCESCKKKISWYDNIPLLSYIVLKGRCRQCGAYLSLSHPVIESLVGFLFIWWYVVGFFFFQISLQPFSFLQPLFWLFVGIVLLFILIIDYKYLVISDLSVLVLTAVTLFYRVALVLSGIMQLQDFSMSIVGMAGSVLFFWLLWFFTKKKGLGFGDVKLAIPLALLVGWPEVFVWLLSSFCLGSLVGIALIMLGKARFGKPIPFGPFLIIGTLISLIWGNQLLVWYATLIL